MIFRWLFSRTVRQANDLCHRVEKLLNSQSDVLAPTAAQTVRASIQELRAAAGDGERPAIEDRANQLEKVASKWLKPYPYAGVRENVDVVLVALVVALGIRTFFLQPMAIPTGSMQPTLFGITQQNLGADPNARIPNVLVRVFNGLARGMWYCHITAAEDGVFQRLTPPVKVLPFVTKQDLIVGGHAYSVWFPPDEFETALRRAGLQPGQSFRKGEDILKLKVISGDRLFVDRFTYNFRPPHRGEIIIFASHGLPDLTPDTHYIKRLIGLPGEKIRILNDRQVAINGRELTASMPHFENIYSFNGPPREDHYSGHVNTYVAQQSGRSIMATLFPDENSVYAVPPHEFFVCGDNTMNSFDSRYWGAFPEDHVVGKCAFVFWPISSRFGWAVQ